MLLPHLQQPVLLLHLLLLLHLMGAAGSGVLPVNH